MVTYEGGRNWRFDCNSINTAIAGFKMIFVRNGIRTEWRSPIRSVILRVITKLEGCTAGA